MNEIEQYLTDEKISSKILSCQINENIISASLILKIENKSILSLLEKMSAHFPDGKFDIYSR